jgi:hypothetical protein
MLKLTPHTPTPLTPISRDLMFYLGTSKLEWYCKKNLFRGSVWLDKTALLWNICDLTI